MEWDMRTQRNSWLLSLTTQEFAKLNVWDFITHPETRSQAIAEVRSKLGISMPDSEILAVLQPGLYETVKAAVAKHHACEPEARGKRVIGAMLAYIRLHGLAAILDEVPGSGSMYSAEFGTGLEGCIRSHAIEPYYDMQSSEYLESISESPQFLSGGVAFADTSAQARHRLCESVRHNLTTYEHRVLRMTVVDQLTPVQISEALELTARHVWVVRRSLRKRLREIASEIGLGTDVIQNLLPDPRCEA